MFPAVYKSLLTLFVALILGSGAWMFHVAVVPATAFAFGGAFFTHVYGARPGRREIIATLAAGAVFAALYLGFRGPTPPFAGRILGLTGAFLGLGSLQIVATRWIWAQPADRRRALECMLETALIPVFGVISIASIGIAAGVTPFTWDPVLYALDLKFGFAPSWVAGRWLIASPWLNQLCAMVYNSLPLCLAVFVALQWRDRQAKLRVTADLRWILMLMGSVGFLLYQVCPAAGPVYLSMKDFPLQLPAAMPIGPATLAPYARNGMPSLHLGFALLCFWSARDRAVWLRWAAGVFVAITFLATLGLGEHYLIDLVVAPGFALAVQAVGTRSSGLSFVRYRWAGVSIGFGITAFWLIAIRTGAAMAVPAGGAMWSVALVSAFLPLWIEPRLFDRASAPQDLVVNQEAGSVV